MVSLPDCRDFSKVLNEKIMSGMKFRFLAIFLYLGASLLSQSCKTIGEESFLYQKSVVWTKGENSVDGYRIPGIVVSAKGTILAFTEERPVFGDADPKSLVVKRSMDSGNSWSENIYIEKADGQYWHQNTDLIHPEDDKDKKEVWTNVAPIVDKETGKIFFFYALSEGKLGGQNLQRYTRVYYRYSEDDGITWSDRVEVTDVINSKQDGTPNKDENGNWITDENGFPCDYLGRAFHMPGPGHGIQLKDGRLLLQIWNRKALGVPGEGEIAVEKRNYGVCTIYSDDHGKTWKYGSSFGQDLHINESRLVELENGDIYMNARYVPTQEGERNNHRVTAISSDGGKTWKNVKVDTQFPVSNHCDGGLISLKNSSGKVVLLYSKNESTEGRKNLVVRLSEDQGKSWNFLKVIDEGPAGYSDMAVSQDNTVFLLYETGKNSPVYCAAFNLKWLKK